MTSNFEDTMNGKKVKISFEHFNTTMYLHELHHIMREFDVEFSSKYQIMYNRDFWLDISVEELNHDNE